jgi:hypothetical protein
LRSLVVTILNLTRQLRQRHDRDVELLSEGLQARGDLCDFLHAIFQRSARRALQQLNVVDDEEVQPLLPLQASGARSELRNRQSAGFIDEKRQMLQFDGNILDLLEVAFVNSAAPDRA